MMIPAEVQKQTNKQTNKGLKKTINNKGGKGVARTYGLHKGEEIGPDLGTEGAMMGVPAVKERPGDGKQG